VNALEASDSGNKAFAESVERPGMATGLVSLMQLSRQLRQQAVGCIDLEVIFKISMGGAGAAAVGPWDAAIAVGLPTGALLVRYVDPHQPDLVALEYPEKVHKPVASPDQVVGNDVNAFVQIDPDGEVAGMP